MLVKSRTGFAMLTRVFGEMSVGIGVKVKAQVCVLLRTAVIVLLNLLVLLPMLIITVAEVTLL